ncbi:Leukotriene A-4 hydrolase [Portunus trituberculatus]|uniref:Leukotriene A-4 hydrolase n=1 Tax=Portunus trituberculatus TaxID=210409 RepID=A0A5B7DJT9_PORTR|nr:Leukotriene A-4 hydrolase [Portunus trituberculatus]
MSKDQVVVRELHLDWQVDFTRQVVAGFVLLTVECVQEGQDLILDTRDLVIKSVQDSVSSRDLTHTLGEAHPNFGAPLSVTLPEPGKKTTSINSACPVQILY